ncbi:glycosyltransferase N-terminal domain-containing protein [Jhaorihella thermophila]
MGASGGGPTPLYRFYRTATRALVPLAWASVSRKLRRHGVATERMQERLGHASLPRPAAPVIWFHAASVGESLSVLSLITRMGQRLPDAEFLITSGTATSAELVAKRLPPRTRHQFAPLDAPGPVGRFLDHWRPAAGLFVESELWPNMLVMARERGARLALVNARLSEASVRGWLRRAETARFLLSRFDLLMAQSTRTARDLISMGAPRPCRRRHQPQGQRGGAPGGPDRAETGARRPGRAPRLDCQFDPFRRGRGGPSRTKPAASGQPRPVPCPGTPTSRTRRRGRIHGPRRRTDALPPLAGRRDWPPRRRCIWPIPSAKPAPGMRSRRSSFWVQRLCQRGAQPV